MTTTKMTTRELWDMAVRLRATDWFADGCTRLDFAAADRDRPEGWWGLTPVSMFDDDTWLIGYYGGGSTVAVDLSDEADEDDRADKIVCAIRRMLDIKEENPFPEDDVVFVDTTHASLWLEEHEHDTV